MSISPWPHWTNYRPLTTDAIRSSQDLIADNFQAIGSVLAEIIPGLGTADTTDYIGPASEASIWNVGSIGDAPSHAIGDINQNGVHRKWDSDAATFDTLADWVLSGTVVLPGTSSWELGSADDRMQKGWFDDLDVTTIVASVITPSSLTATIADIGEATIDMLHAPTIDGGVAWDVDTITATQITATGTIEGSPVMADDFQLTGTPYLAKSTSGEATLVSGATTVTHGLGSVPIGIDLSHMGATAQWSDGGEGGFPVGGYHKADDNGDGTFTVTANYNTSSSFAWIARTLS